MYTLFNFLLVRLIDGYLQSLICPYPQSYFILPSFKVKHVAMPRTHHVTTAIVVFDITVKQGTT